MQANTDTQTCGLMLDRPTSLRFQRVVCLCSKPTLINEQRGYYKTERVEDLQFNQLHLLQWHDTFENALQRGSIVEKNYCFWKNKVSKQNRDLVILGHIK